MTEQAKFLTVGDIRLKLKNLVKEDNNNSGLVIKISVPGYIDQNVVGIRQNGDHIVFQTYPLSKGVV